MKKTNKLIMLLLTLSMIIGMSTFAVFADEVEHYSLWVQGRQVTSDNAGDVLGDGKVSYNASTKTLTLDNANINSTPIIDYDNTGIFAMNMDLTIKLIGKNTIVGNGDFAEYGIKISESLEADASLTITGEGSLEISDVDNGVYSGEAPVEIKNATVDINEAKQGILTMSTDEDDGEIIITNANVKAIGQNCGIFCNGGNIEIRNSMVEASTSKTSDDGVAGIQVNEGTIGIYNSTVKAEGDWGIRAVEGNIIIRDSTMEATGTDRSAICTLLEEKEDCNNIEISNSKATATGGVCGISGDGKKIEITDSNVTATGSAHGIMDCFGDVIINSGTVKAIASDPEPDTGYCNGISAGGIAHDDPGSELLPGNVIIKGGNVTAKGDSFGILTRGDIKISGGNVTVDGDDNGMVSVPGNIDISGGKVDATGGAYGIAAGNYEDIQGGKISVSGRATRVVATSKGMKNEQVKDDPVAAILAGKDGTKADKTKNIVINYNDGLAIVLPKHGTVEADTQNYDEGYFNYSYIAERDKSIALKAIIEPAAPAEPLIATINAKGKKGVKATWNALSDADGYDVFFSRCNTKKKKYTCKYVGTVEGSNSTSWTKSGLKKGVPYKMYVRAYYMKDGQKIYIAKSPSVHAFTNGGSKKYTNPKSVKVKKASVSVKAGKTYKIKASVTKLKKSKKLINTNHAPKLRYLSSDTSVATVSKSGKIKGKAAGSCKVYVYAVNGAKKVVKVTVK